MIFQGPFSVAPCPNPNRPIRNVHVGVRPLSHTLHVDGLLSLTSLSQAAASVETLDLSHNAGITGAGAEALAALLEQATAVHKRAVAASADAAAAARTHVRPQHAHLLVSRVPVCPGAHWSALMLP
jgi:hypothetical protein